MRFAFFSVNRINHTVGDFFYNVWSVKVTAIRYSGAEVCNLKGSGEHFSLAY